MIDIALLGSVSVSVDGVLLSGEAAQRRRVALLTLLVAPALRPVSRDRLIGLIWPDNSPDSARHLLSAALHVLRKALGQDALVTSGEDVAVNPQLVHADVPAFREAVAAGDVEKALSLYRGDFMEGFFVNDAADYSEWVEGERSELRRLYGEALERAAQQRAEASDAAGAAAAWRKRAALDPYDGRVAVALMRSLATVGQRGAAIQHARLHAQLLEQEFGAAPDPQVEALAAELRQAPAEPVAAPPISAATPAAVRAAEPLAPLAAANVAAPPQDPASAGPPTAMPPGYVSSVAAASETQRAGRQARPHGARLRRYQLGLLRKLALPLAVALVIVTALLLASRKSTLLIGVRPFTSEDSALNDVGMAMAREMVHEVARIEGVQTVVHDVAFQTVTMDTREAIRHMDADLAIGMTMHQGSDGLESIYGNLELTDRHGVNVLSDEVKGSSITELEHAVRDRVARHLNRKLLPESPSELAADSADPAAQRRYIEGLEEWLQRTPESLRRALEHYEQAIEIDPDYALAWAGKADALNMLGSYDYAGLAPDSAYPRADSAARRALALDPDLAVAYAALANTQANYYWNWKAADANYRRAVDLKNTRASANEWYALLLAATGRMAEAKRQTLEAVERQPTVPLTRVNHAHVLYYAGEYPEAREHAQHALRYDPTFSRALIIDAAIDLVSGEEQRALEKLTRFRAASPAPEPLLVGLLGYAQARNDQREAARVQLQWLENAEQTRYVPPEFRALVHVALDEHDAAFEQLWRAYRFRSSGLPYLKVEPLIRPLYGDPRFQELLDSVF